MAFTKPPSSTSAVQNASSSASSTAAATVSTSKPPNMAPLGGIVGGGAGAILILAVVSWFVWKKTKSAAEKKSLGPDLEESRDLSHGGSSAIPQGETTHPPPGSPQWIQAQGAYTDDSEAFGAVPYTDTTPGPAVNAGTASHSTIHHDGHQFLREVAVYIPPLGTMMSPQEIKFQKTLQSASNRLSFGHPQSPGYQQASEAPNHYEKGQSSQPSRAHGIPQISQPPPSLGAPLSPHQTITPSFKTLNNDEKQGGERRGRPESWEIFDPHNSNSVDAPSGSHTLGPSDNHGYSDNNTGNWIANQQNHGTGQADDRSGQDQHNTSTSMHGNNGRSLSPTTNYSHPRAPPTAYTTYTPVSYPNSDLYSLSNYGDEDARSTMSKFSHNSLASKVVKDRTTMCNIAGILQREPRQSPPTTVEPGAWNPSRPPSIQGDTDVDHDAHHTATNQTNRDTTTSYVGARSAWRDRS